jgi:hypothetical protein
MDPSTRAAKLNELTSLRIQATAIDRQISSLEEELQRDHPGRDWRDREGYFTYYATTGFFLGMIGAIASLLFNILGSIAIGQHPLKLIQVYLTFGLGEQAQSAEFNNALALLVGCCLYVGTGMVYGVPFQIIMNRVAPHADLLTRLLWATWLGLGLWIINYYGILSWLQPLLFGGRWIVDEVPWYVGATTHLVFAWTMAVLYPYGVFSPYRVTTEQA